MSANTDPVFALSPNVGVGQLAVANPNRDGTGTLVDVFTAAANGSRADKVVIRGKATTTAGMVRLFLKLASGAISLLEEVPVDAITVGANVAGFGSVIDLVGGLVLPAGAKIQAAPHNAELFSVTIFGGDF